MKLVIAVLFAAAAAPLAAAEPIDARWNEVARDRDGDCRLTVTSEGRFFRIAASGLGAGEQARLVLEVLVVGIGHPERVEAVRAGDGELVHRLVLRGG